MRKILFILLLFSVSTIFAYDKLQDIRYTMGSEYQGRSKMQFGVGLHTSFNSEATVPIQLQGRLSKYFELGTKIILDKQNEWEGNMDIGAKFFFSSGSYIALDGYFGINRDNGGAGIISYGNRHHTAKNFYVDYETRLGLGDAIVYPDGLFKISVGVKPTLRFGEPVIASIEINTSGSVGELDEDYKMDLIPKLELILGNVSIALEYNIGILLDSNNSRNIIGLYVRYGF
ncbi:MAG: hypothetical protein UIH18_05250 [Fibrobacteraceae bacterium]|jgi:hypothetical protein|nr:hypothetical protein [Fibrobacteraceae bacterium]MEE0876684.1 hypothetical protein [Fibrobacteraceae bacterium]MEE1276765.1 hypothetical protein [Fibrobacteraceae bacterium]